MMLIHLLLVLIIYCCNVPTAADLPVFQQQADIIFLVDASAEANVPLEQELVNDVVDRLDVSQSATRVSVVSYSKGYKPLINLDDKGSKDDIKKAVGKINPKGRDERDAHRAIKHAREHFEHNLRDAARIIIYISTGNASEPKRAQKEAKKAKQKAQLFVVGVGDKISSKELKKYASEPKTNFMHKLVSPNGVGHLSDELVRQIYGESPEAPTPPTVLPSATASTTDGSAIPETIMPSSTDIYFPESIFSATTGSELLETPVPIMPTTTVPTTTMPDYTDFSETGSPTATKPSNSEPTTIDTPMPVMPTTTVPTAAMPDNIYFPETGSPTAMKPFNSEPTTIGTPMATKAVP